MLAATWGPRLPALARDLHVDTAQIGAILAASTVGLLVGLMASSAVARLLGIRRAIGTALGVVAVCMGLVATGAALGSPLAVVAGLLTLGIATGVLDVVVNVDGSTIEQRTGRSFLPLLHALWLVGAAAGAGIGAGCAALGLAPAVQFAGEAVLVAVAGIGIVWAIPGGDRGDAEAAVEGTPLRARFRGWLRGWTDRRLLLLGLLIFGVELAEGSARTWLPSAVERGYDQPAWAAALFVTLFSIGTAGFRAFGGPVVDRFGRIPVVRITIAIGIVGLVLFIVGGNVWLVLIGTILWSIGNCLAGPLGMSAAAEGGPGAAARVGVVSSIGFFAGLAGPPLVGFLAQQIGLVPSFWLLVAFLVVAFATTPALAHRGADSRTPG
jgi:MFS family permease